jgi:hypothetical protein
MIETTGHIISSMGKTIPKTQVRLKLLETGIQLFVKNGYNGTEMISPGRF